jgi:uncharacterized protein YbjQ (UPF0145 family)
MATLQFTSEGVAMTTSHSFDNTEITSYEGLIVADVAFGRHIGRDILSNLRDFFGGRSRSWEKTIRQSQQHALEELAEEARARGANGVIGIDIVDETIGGRGGMLNVKAVGTAVVTKAKQS